MLERFGALPALVLILAASCSVYSEDLLLLGESGGGAGGASVGGRGGGNTATETGTDTETSTGTDTETGTGTGTETSTGTGTETSTGTETGTGTGTLTLWINEIHYDNAGGDVDEGVEVAGTAGGDLSGYSVILYNGSNGSPYDSPISLGGILPDEGGGLGTAWFPKLGLQNGAPDGVALIGPSDELIQFLSYEGTISATSGPAQGQMSIDIGVEELGTENGASLQLTGSGSSYADFTWNAPAPSSPGAVNPGQTFQ